MSDPDRRYADHTSPFWSIAVIFVAVMLGLAAYGYFETHPGTTTGQATPEASPSAPATSNQP